MSIVHNCDGSVNAAATAASNAAEAAQAAADAAVKAAAEAAKIADEQRRLAEADNTDLKMVPILTSSDVKVECLGMFFNMQGGFRAEDVPSKELTIEKDVLDRSSQFIVARFKADIKDRSKIVFEASLDGVKLDGGTNLPYIFTSGSYDTTLIKYPNTAKANTDGVHLLHVKTGLITGIVESQLGLIVWDTVKAITEADFRINLLPHKISD